MRMPVLRSICIGDLGRVVTGKTPPSAQPELFGNLYPFITPTDMDWDVRYVEPDRFLSLSGKEYQNRLMLPAAAVCVVCIGATIGKVCMTRCPSFTNQQINSVVVNEKEHDPFFVYHLLTTLRDELKSNAGGAATPIINKTIFSEIKVNAPSLPVQKRIAGILSAYDELIENSQRRIKILEAVARGLYREWFVHFRFPGHENHLRVASSLGEIPQGWEVKTFGELYNTGSGGTPSRARPEYFMDGTIDWVKSQELLDGFVLSTEERITERAILESSAKLFPANSVLVALYGATIGKLAILSRDAATNQACCAVLPKLKSFGREFAYLTLFVNREKIISMRLGAAQQNISQVLLRGLECLKPKDELVSHFSKVTSPFFDEILALQRQIHNLRRTRDLLLPRLLSGQIDVSKLDDHEETLS